MAPIPTLPRSAPRLLRQSAGAWIPPLRLLASATLLTASLVPAWPAAVTSEVVDFDRDIAPILTRACIECHGAGKQKGGLRIDSRAGAMAGGDSKTATLLPGQPEQSGLIQRITATNPDDRMPQKGPPLPDAEIQRLRAWVAQGARWPETQTLRPPPGAESPSTTVSAQDRAFWSFQGLSNTLPPTVRDSNWPSTPMDRYILARLESAGLAPAPPASRQELIRRVSFDLTGLPPSPETAAAFVADTSPGAWGRVIDACLSSPRYGERWAQHWLDVVRFAETEGFEYDNLVPDAWRYRDWVIRAFNEDLPYDRFLFEQLAGDEQDPPTQDGRIAAGFFRLGPVRRNAGNQNVSASRNEVLTERTDSISTVFLGLTMGCARCHDHKFDPIPQSDYYRLQAFLAPMQDADVPLVTQNELARWRATEASVTNEIHRLRQSLKDAKGDEEARILSRIKETERRLPKRLPALATIRNEYQELTPVHVLRRGDWERKAGPVGMRFPSVLVPDSVPELPLTQDSPRTRLAAWLTSSNQALTARVIVNRVWQQHFGSGLVRSANDLGANGERPTHPELLDRLARDLIDGGWRIKSLHRQILLSTTYQQSGRSTQPARGLRVDPDNRMLWRFPRRRLQAEELRDAMLCVAGRLNAKAGGASVILPVDQDLIDLLYKPSQWIVTEAPTEHARRSIYLLSKRNLRLPFLEVFDEPTRQASCARRESSTHAPQSLELLNGATANTLASAFASRLEREAGRDSLRQIELAFRLTCGRPPSSGETAVARRFLHEHPLKEFALALFNLNAFLYVD